MPSKYEGQKWRGRRSKIVEATNDRALAIRRCATRIAKRITLRMKIALRENIKLKRRSKLAVLISSRSFARRADRAISGVRSKRRTIQKILRINFESNTETRVRNGLLRVLFSLCTTLRQDCHLHSSLIKKFTFIVLPSIRPTLTTRR